MSCQITSLPKTGIGALSKTFQSSYDLFKKADIVI